MSDGQYPVPADNRNWIRGELAKLRGEIGDANRRAMAAAAAAGAAAGAIPVVPQLPNRNLIINGNFRTNQRGYVSGTPVTLGGALALTGYTFDRWKVTATGTTINFTAAPQGQPISFQTGRSIVQIVERGNVLPGDYVLSFGGDGGGMARVYNVGATPPAYALSPIPVTLDGTANVVVELANVFFPHTFAQVQLERGTMATPYEHIDTTTELLRCQRYFYIISPTELGVINPYWNVNLNAGGQILDRRHPVVMRANPVLKWANGTIETQHIFTYLNYSAGTAGAYYTVLSGSVNGITASYNSGGGNGSTLLPIGRTAGQNANPIWVDAEM